MRVNFTCGLRGRYKLSVRKAVEIDGEIVAGALVRETPWFDNLITDGGLEELGAVSSVNVLGFCHVGTGSTTPSNGDTSLVAFVASVAATSSSFTAQPSSPYYASKIVVYRFGAGAAAGNISEVGVSSVAGATRSIFSRALVLDGGGSPTTITVLSDEFLDVTYELRYYPPLTDVTGSVTLDGTSYSYTIRASKVTDAATWGNNIGVTAGVASSSSLTAYTGSIGTVEQTPSGTTITATPTFANLTYSANSLERDMEATFGLDDANGNIGAIQFRTTMGAGQIGFSPVVPKANTQVLDMVFSVTWARKTLP